MTRPGWLASLRRRSAERRLMLEPRACARPGCAETFTPRASERKTRRFCSTSCAAQWRHMRDREGAA